MVVGAPCSPRRAGRSKTIPERGLDVPADEYGVGGR
ncbi:hypothetical protein ABH917_000524 [Thermobifida halotolerans]